MIRFLAYVVNFKFLPNMGVGLMWHSDRFFLGVSAPKILKELDSDQTGEMFTAKFCIFMGWEVYVFF